MSKGVVVLMVPFLAALLLAACDGANEAPSPTPPPIKPTPTATHTATATAITPSTGDPITASQRKVIFIRQTESVFTLRGVLWMANLDGSMQKQLTPDDVQATFAGLIGSKSGSSLFYYVTYGDEGVRTLWRLNPDSGERAVILEYEGRADGLGLGNASVTSDGRYVAFSHAEGIDLLGLATGERRRIVTSSWAPCEEGYRGCFGYDLPSWSPDGSLLLVVKGFWEGGVPVVLDFFAEPPQVHVEASPADRVPTVAEWSSDSATFCGHGRYGGASGLYLASAPDWQPTNLLPRYEAADPEGVPLDGQTVTDCDWLDERRIVYSSSYLDMPPRSEIAIYDLAIDEVTLVASFNDDELLFTRHIVADPAGQFVITQFVRPLRPEKPHEPSQPVMVDVSTGALASALEPGDWVVAVVQP